MQVTVVLVIFSLELHTVKIKIAFKMLSVYFHTGHPSSCEVLSHGGLICISLVTMDVEHLLVHLMVIVDLFWRKSDLSPLPIFLI